MVSIHVAREQQKVVRAAVGRGLAEAAALGQVGLQADDRLNAGFFARGVEVDGAVEAAVVGDGEGLHPQLAGALHHATDAAEAIEHAELGVVVEVSEQYYLGRKTSVIIALGRAAGTICCVGFR